MAHSLAGREVSVGASDAPWRQLDLRGKMLATSTSAGERTQVAVILAAARSNLLC